MLSAVDSFRIDLPASWRELPLDLASLRGELLGDPDDEKWAQVDPVERRRLDLYLQRLLVDVAAVDARFIAVLSQTFEPAEGEDPGPPLTASCVISVLNRAAVGSDLPLTSAVIQAAMSIDVEPSAVLAEQKVTNLNEPQIVELPHEGSAVHVSRLVEFGAIGRDQLSVASETFFVPVADTFDEVLVVQFSTPNLEDATLLSELFRAIADTVRLYREGEETVL
jgi:hypothetical protein